MTWTKRWGYWLEKTKTVGVYRLKTGGFFVRAKVTAPQTGVAHEVTAVLATVPTTKDARRELDALVEAERSRHRGAPRSRQPWIDFAVSTLEERVRRGSIQSAATVEWWRGALAVFGAAWGDVDVTAVTNAHYRDWLDTTVAKWMSKGRTTKRKRRDGTKEVEVTTVLSPAYVNGWLRILRTISNVIADRFDLPKNPFKGIEFFVEGRAHTKEQPNSLTSELLPMFMAIARAEYPQFYAMVLLGMVTGLRPSSLRPLRRKGLEADLDWETGVLLVRRSHSRRQKIMNRTKQGTDGSITLPHTVLDELRAHVATLTGKASTSDLLFPNAEGAMWTRTGLTKPFAAITKELGLTFKLTPKGMRRTFNDIMREAGTHDVVTRSISGHMTEEMQLHYSTAQGKEQRAALERALAFVKGNTTPMGGKTGGKGDYDAS